MPDLLVFSVDYTPEMLLADAHVHTTRSDGWWEPDRLAEAAVARGLSAIGITDHDVVAATQIRIALRVPLLVATDIVASVLTRRAAHAPERGFAPITKEGANSPLPSGSRKGNAVCKRRIDRVFQAAIRPYKRWPRMIRRAT
jgi:hypothetical protein